MILRPWYAMLRTLARAASWVARALGEPYPPSVWSKSPGGWVHLFFHDDRGNVSFSSFDSEWAAAVFLRAHPEQHANFFGAFIELEGFMGRALGHQEDRQVRAVGMDFH